VPYQDFRAFLDALRSAGELLEVDRAVSPELEVAKAMRKNAAVSGPAIIFKNNGTAFPLVGGVYLRSPLILSQRTQCVSLAQLKRKGRCSDAARDTA
jgi:UbiD family decarboxylase